MHACVCVLTGCVCCLAPENPPHLLCTPTTFLPSITSLSSQPDLDTFASVSLGQRCPLSSLHGHHVALISNLKT